jgi:GT2 family glycosyltransferase
MNIPVISIVMAYCNRKSQLIYTLESIKKSKVKDIEIIIVDDCSKPEHSIDDLLTKYPAIKLIRIKLKDKWYINSCVPYNIGLKQAVGKIIILQNPECLHIHDVLSYAIENITDSNYISMGCYALDRSKTETMHDYFKNNKLIDFFKSLPNVAYEPTSWYNHSIYRPGHYHFCSAITRKNMNKLGGFDERYAHGIGFDDNEIVERIKRLGLELIIADSTCVFHQYHETIFDNRIDYLPLYEKNKQVFHRITMKEEHYNPNPPKDIDDLHLKLTETFTKVYDNNIWGSKETKSGYGSELKQAVNLVKQMPKICKKHGITGMIDIGCGDFNWMKKIAPSLQNYLGIDIVQEMIDKNTEKHGNNKIKFEYNHFPYWLINFYDKKYNAVLFADIFVHLPYFISLAYINAVKKTGIEYMFATTFTDFHSNKDISIEETGWRPLNLQDEPFNLDKPLELMQYNEPYIEDEDKIKNDKYIGLWKIN